MSDTNAMLPAKNIQIIARKILPKNNSRLWHEALMDFGATICTKRNPQCSECPLSGLCKSGKVLIEKAATQSTKSLTSTEQKYFGHPKRIWRGRVLKLISINGEIGERQILHTLIRSENKPEFKELINHVLSALLREGFCKSEKKGVYTLA